MYVMAGEREQQVFLKDWLVEQINSGKYEGVEWLDKEQKVFKIPWTHSKKNGYCLERDAALFREWAKYRGRYKGDNAKEASAWKINFRCALHGVRNVVEMPELESSFPSSKVYRILPAGLTNKKKKWPDVTGVFAAAESSSCSHDSIACSNGPCTPLVVSREQMVTGSMLRRSDGDDSAYSSDTGSEPMDTTVLQISPALPVPSLNNRNVVKINIMHGSLVVHSDTVDCTNGCRVFYGPLHDRQSLDPRLEETLFGDKDAIQISLKPIHSLGEVAKEIFKDFKRGLIIRAKNGSVYVTPLAPVTVYYGASAYGDSYPILRNQEVCVFDYDKQFLPALGKYLNGKTQDIQVTPHAILSLGQQWSVQRPSTYNLISIIVVPVWAEEVILRKGFQVTPVKQDVAEVDKSELNQFDLIAEEFLNPS